MTPPEHLPAYTKIREFRLLCHLTLTTFVSFVMPLHVLMAWNNLTPYLPRNPDQGYTLETSCALPIMKSCREGGGGGPRMTCVVFDERN